MLFFVPDATFSQQFVLYSFFIGTPILLIALIVYVGFKSAKQNNNSPKCEFCGEFVKDDEYCKFCKEDLIG